KILLQKSWKIIAEIRKKYSKYLKDKLDGKYYNELIETKFLMSIEATSNFVIICKEIISTFQSEKFDLLSNKEICLLFLQVYDSVISILKRWDKSLFKHTYFKLVLLYRELCKRMTGIPKKKYSLPLVCK